MESKSFSRDVAILATNLFLLLGRSMASAALQVGTRSSCGTLDDCELCILAGCIWSEQFQMMPPKQVSRTSEPGKCVNSCEQGNLANCFAAQSYVSLSPKEICAIADLSLPPAIPMAAYVNGVLITRAPTNEPTLAPTLGFMSEIVHVMPPPTTSAPSQEPSSVDLETKVTESPSYFEDFPVDDDEDALHTASTTNEPNATVLTSNNANWSGWDTLEFDVATEEDSSNVTVTGMVQEVSCTGFIACEECPGDGLACAHVAWNCAAYCPELSHIPCFEMEGNYSAMTAEDVCGDPNGDDDSLFDLSMDVSRSISQPESKATARCRSYLYTVMGLLTGVASLIRR